MAHTPKLAVSGYRGIWDETLNKEIVESFVRAFAVFTKTRNGNKILVGRDARESGSLISSIVIETLTAAGIDVVDGGLLPTPTILYGVRTLKFDGAVIITASHNPGEYNGLKFVTAKAMFTTEAEVAEIVKNMEAIEPQREATSLGSASVISDLPQKHVAHILSYINVEAIRAKKFKVVLDSINSVGVIPAKILFDALGCEVTYVNGLPDGKFAHRPEPTPENISGITPVVQKEKADVGFAQDPDADRLIVCDETGTIISEELTVAFGTEAVMRKTPGTFVTNVATSRVAQDIAESYGGNTYLTKVGEGNVVEEMVKQNAIFGGEGSAGIIYPKINFCRDSITGMALILELMAETNQSVSAIVSKFPKTFMLKSKLPIDIDLPTLYGKLQEAFPFGVPNTQDGFRLDFADKSWISLRPSNTEPIARIHLEAYTQNNAEELMKQAKIALGNS